MVQIHSLTKLFGEVRAVDDVSFSVSKGEIVGLLGPNGAGKTTTLRVMTGYLMPTAGTVYVKDVDVREDPITVKKYIGYLPESAPLYQDMLVYDYLHYVADIRGLTGEAKQERIAHLSKVCGIREVMHKSIGTLSKGYNQRVGLAYAMMSDPEILVLDEPTSGLDPNQIAEIRGIIKEIGKEKTVVFSTHILSEAEATCDRVIIINNGKIAADGTTSLLQDSTGDENTVRLTVQGPTFSDLQSVISKIPGIQQVAEEPVPADGDSDTVVCARITTGGDNRKPIYEAIKDTPWTLLEFTQEKKSLEHIFRELTKE